MPHSNHLIHETSPYLLQHAHNPVDWYPWSEEALNRARQENKPILVSIGYSACHWCHVMERESFENEEVAAFMNDHFINIKIDREERPDLDHIYMDAVQAMTGSGGWPLNVFLTPDARPFYGGTYFPPQRAFNRPSWMETLEAVADAFQKRRNEIDAQAENLTQHIVDSNSFGLQTDTEGQPDQDDLDKVYQLLMKTGDMEWGGFGKAPKFPQTFSIRFLLAYFHLTGQQPALELAQLSLDKMIEGGMYDQLGGGFARYSTDREWLAPHFEKMLYDNALLVSALSDAFALSGKERYREVIRETMAFVQRELMSPEQAFYSALDADSEGVEGKFYTWSLQEIEALLGEDAHVFCAYYDVSEKGNWEHTNILRVTRDHVQVAEELGMDPHEAAVRIVRASRKLFDARSKRVRPQLDDKVLLGWNALMNTAASKAFAVTGDRALLDLALGNMDFLLRHFFDKETGNYFHTWKEGRARYPAFLDDLALLTEAMIHLAEVSADAAWLEKAAAVTDHVIQHFSEGESGFFFYTSDQQGDLILRKKEVYDGALPSGNSVMSSNLYKLGILLDRPEWRERALRMLTGLQKAILKYPGSFGNWACLLQEWVAGTDELVVAGESVNELHEQLLALYLPHRVLLVANPPSAGLSLVKGKPLSGQACVFLCRNYTCHPPVFTTSELIALKNRLKKQ